MSACVRLENITVSYDRHPALHHVSGAFACGSLTAIAGPNGAGKSTLLKTLAGLIVPESGQLHFEAISAREVAYLPQISDLHRDVPLTLEQLVCTGHWRRSGAFGGISAAQRAACAQALEAVGLAGFAPRPAGSLSAGQFQRALFARLLLQDAKLILLDEPFSALDEQAIQAMLDIIRRWHAEGRTVVSVLHDASLIERFFRNACCWRVNAWPGVKRPR